ncbi:hypothetical protein SDC9_170300 [bioreactor metagenome]|uniref:RNA polymerase sigma-70 region 4 domain-containing protein n=1 Tax=bioreactor metagenome TaxID=1076179 RepID=A0A645G8F3_9ZZZZ
MEFETGEGLTLQDGIEDDFSIEEQYLKKETYKELQKGIKLLNKEEQYMIKWIYFDGRSLKDYAQLKGITYNQGRYRMQKTLQKLKEFLQ